MKTLVIVILLNVALQLPTLAQDPIKMGDNISSYLSTHTPKKVTPYPNFFDWKGMTDILYAQFEHRPDSADPFILMSVDSVPFGALQKNRLEATYWYDTDNDGLIDQESDIALMPIWLVIRSGGNPDSGSNMPDEIFNTFYSLKQSNLGMKDTLYLRVGFSMVRAYVSDSTLPNRDLVYPIVYYFMFSNIPRLQLLAMNTLEELYEKRFGRMHPFILLNKLEATFRMHNDDAARQVLQKLLGVDPSSVPGKVYQFKLEKDPIVATKLRTELERDHPSHWMVKELP